MKNEQWHRGSFQEIEFWDHWLETSGDKWPDDFAFRCDPNSQFQENLIPFLNDSQNKIRILDVGAGPLTILGKRWQDYEIEIVPTDALAEEYEKLLRRHNVNAPVQTLYIKGEEIGLHFLPDQFDLVYARNSVDHSENPLKVIRNMLGVVRPGAYVVLSHALREGKRASYSGLHQWDFYSQNNNFFIDGMGQTVNVSDQFLGMADVKCHEESDWLMVSMLKVGSE